MQKNTSWKASEEALGWADAYLGELSAAVERLRSHENRGAARVGQRVHRYIDMSKHRLALLMSGLNSKQRAALGLLPVLLHVNQATIPGGIESRLPIFGVKGLRPTPILERYFRIALSLELSDYFLEVDRPIIEAVFLESPLRTLGERTDKEIHVYLVANLRSLGDAAVRTLLTRLEKISEWYLEKDIVLSCTFLDPVWTSGGDFGRVGGDIAQGFLKLDEFYVNSFLLCGSVPIFWCTAPGTPLEQYQKASAMIRRVDFDPELNFVDLGYVRLPKPSVRRRAMLGLLNHDVSMQLGFLLKLIQLTFGANASVPLSDPFKLSVFRSSSEPEYVDQFLYHFEAAFLILEHHQKWALLYTLRDLLIAKVALRANRVSYSYGAFLEEMGCVRAIVSRWGWGKDAITFAHQLHTLEFVSQPESNKKFQHLLKSVYQELSDAARKQAGRFDEAELTLLGRRLLAVLSAKNGRIIPHFGYALQENLGRNFIHINLVGRGTEEEEWALSAGQSDSELGQMYEVFRSRSLLTGLCWLSAQQISRRHSRLDVSPSAKRLNRGLVESFLQATTELFGDLNPLINRRGRFAEAAKVSGAIVILNFDDLERGQLEEKSNRKHYLPSNWDILNYGRERESRLRDVAVLTVDTWDCCHLRRLRGRDAVRKALRLIYQNKKTSKDSSLAPKVIAPEGREARAAQDRLDQLISKIESVTCETRRVNDSASFVYEVGGRFQVLQRRGENIRCYDTRSLPQALKIATPIGLQTGNVQIDVLSPSLSMVRQLKERAMRDSDGLVHVAWRKGNLRSELLVLDAAGRMYFTRTKNARFENIFVLTLRRLIHLLKDRAKDLRTLRKLLRVYEVKDSQGEHQALMLSADSLRALKQVGAHAQRGVSVSVSGDIFGGRDGIAFEVGGKRFDPEQLGRKAVLLTVLQILENASKTKESTFATEVSNVDMGVLDEHGRFNAVVHLRLLDLCQRLLQRTVNHLRSGNKTILQSNNKFGRRLKHE